MNRLGDPLRPDVEESPADIRKLQEGLHNHAYDYRAGSPHLKHWGLHERLTTLVRSEVERNTVAGIPPSLLEVGAGHGGFTEPLLASGCDVTVTEMSRHSLERLTTRYGRNSRFSAVLDTDGSLSAVGDRKFAVVFCASVLHHIPDYLAVIQGPLLARIAQGGTFVSIQDPMWYPHMRRIDRALTKVAYLSWRLIRGNLRQGLMTQLRRARGVYNQQHPSDMVEYHVVRSGVNHNAIIAALSPHFEELRLVPYWSTQSSVWQTIGEGIGRTNTFALVARGFRG